MLVDVFQTYRPTEENHELSQLNGFFSWSLAPLAPRRAFFQVSHLLSVGNDNVTRFKNCPRSGSSPGKSSSQHRQHEHSAQISQFPTRGVYPHGRCLIAARYFTCCGRIIDDETNNHAKITAMLRGILVLVILVLVFFPAQSWLCQSSNTVVQIVTSPCDNTFHFELTAPIVGIGLFFLLNPLMDATNPKPSAFPLAYSPLLHPKEPVLAKQYPPPRSTPVFFPSS